MYSLPFASPLVSLSGSFCMLFCCINLPFLVYTEHQEVGEGTDMIAFPQEEGFYAPAAQNSGHLANEFQVESVSEADWK